MRTPKIAAALAGTLFIAATGPVLAPGSEMKEATALQGTKTTLAGAIATAELQTGGKAFGAGVDADHGTPRIVVEPNGAKGVQTVIMDAGSGQVVGGHAGGEAD